MIAFKATLAHLTCPRKVMGGGNLCKNDDFFISGPRPDFFRKKNLGQRFLLIFDGPCSDSVKNETWPKPCIFRFSSNLFSHNYKGCGFGQKYLSPKAVFSQELLRTPQPGCDAIRKLLADVSMTSQKSWSNRILITSTLDLHCC